MIIDPTSMVKTVDNINEMFLYGKKINHEDGVEVSHWIIAQQGKKGAYRNMFAPTPSDFEQGIRVFTGERLVSASARHIMGQEAARVSWLLNSTDPLVVEAYNRATSWMPETADFQQSGTFCCARCSLAFWRNYKVGNFLNKDALITKGLQALTDNRLGDGTWRRFPFYYAVYTLMDLNLDAAQAELKYARPAMEKFMKKTRLNAYSQRRTAIFQKALELAN